MAERGYYSLIQFVPDPGRAEGANVGVVVVCPALGEVRVRMSETNEGPKRRFGVTSFDDDRLQLAKTALANRLLAELSEKPTPDGIEKARSLEGNALVLGAPRTAAIGNIDAVADGLLYELVRVSESNRERARNPDVEGLIRALRQRHAVIQTPGSVTVPTTGEPLRVAFAYQNGVRNYVHARGFGRNKITVLDTAKKLGAQGHLLYKGTHQSQKLVVLARFAEGQHVDTVNAVLEGLDVRLVDEQVAEEFVEEIVTTAHAIS